MAHPLLRCVLFLSCLAAGEGLQNRLLVVLVLVLPAFAVVGLAVALWTTFGRGLRDLVCIRHPLLALKIALLSGVVVGCSGDLPSKAKMRALVIDAATMRERDYEIDPDTTPLTAIAPQWGGILATTPCALFNENETPEFEMTDPMCSGSTMFPELKQSRFTQLSDVLCSMLRLDQFGLFSERFPDLSIINNDNFTGLRMTAHGDSIVGTVSFEKPDCYRGAVDFVARNGPAGWRVEEFRMPVMGLLLERISDTSWRARTPFQADVSIWR